MKKKRSNLNKIFISFFAIFVLATSVFILINHTTLLGFTIYQTSPSSDTDIRENSTTNFATSTTLRVGRASGIDLRPIIKFDVSSIPNADTISTAVLELYSVYSSSDANLTIKAYLVTAPWTDTGANWYNYTSASEWTYYGGDYNSPEIGSTNIGNALGWYNISITSAVRGWVNSSYNNYGIILVATNAASGDRKEISSYEGTEPPQLFIDHYENAPPTISSVTSSSTLSSPVKEGNGITFTLNWADLDSTLEQIFICNSSDITLNGCSGRLCNTTLSSSNPATCSYTAQFSDNRTNVFWAAVCDLGNCSSAQQGNYYINHAPNMTLTQPIGGETINQSQGNYDIKFNYNDKDSDIANASIYYGLVPNSTSNLIALNWDLSSSSNCYDKDSKISTPNICTYSWNSTGVYGQFYLTIVANDSYDSTRITSGSFNVASLVDNNPPVISSVWLNDSSIYSGKIIKISANVSDQSINNVWVVINTTPSR